MEPSQFNHSITTKKITLNVSQKLTHFHIVILFAVLSITGVFFVITSEDKATLERSSYPCIGFIALTLIFYFIQKRRLRFIVIDTILERNQLQKAIDYVASKRNWKEITSNDDYYLATSYVGLLGGSWGEYITILFYNNKIYFNSICDPNKKTSLSSYGRNREHAKLFKKAISHLEENVRKEQKTSAI